MATREDFEEHVGSYVTSVMLEAKVLGDVGRESPPVAFAVWVGGEPTSDYWDWLIEQAGDKDEWNR